MYITRLDYIGIVQLPVREIYLSLTDHPGQLSLAIPPTKCTSLLISCALIFSRVGSCKCSLAFPYHSPVSFGHQRCLSQGCGVRVGVPGVWILAQGRRRSPNVLKYRSRSPAKERGLCISRTCFHLF